MKLKFIRNLLICLLFTTFIFVIFTIGYFWVTYIDETVTKGQSYGLLIGESKSKTYLKLPAALANVSGSTSIVFMEIEVNAVNAQLLASKPGQSIMVEALLNKVGYPAFKRKKQWDFYVNGSYFNRLTLKFCNERLCEIYRHRKNFELP